MLNRSKGLIRRRMTAVINPSLLTKKKPYEQRKVETLAWTEITDVSIEKFNCSQKIVRVE